MEDERLLIFGQALLDYAAAAALGNEPTVRARCVAVGWDLLRLPAKRSFIPRACGRSLNSELLFCFEFLIAEAGPSSISETVGPLWAL